MSENQDKESLETDSQETYYEKSQNIIESQILNESQDFALIVGEDSDESTKNQSQPVEKSIGDNQTEDYPLEINVIEAENQGVVNEGPTTCGVDKETQHVLTQVDETKKDAVIKGLYMEDDMEGGISQEKTGKDEDEIIQGTPPEISSPSTKLLPGKRRGESIDAPSPKIQKTSQQKDTSRLQNDEPRKACINYKIILSHTSAEKNETPSDILCENTEHFDKSEELDICAVQSHQINTIIKETQDSEDSESILFSNLSDYNNADAKDKSEESGEQDKSSSDQSELQLSEETVSTTCDSVSDVMTNGKNSHEITVKNKTDNIVQKKESDLATKKIANTEDSIDKKDSDAHLADDECSNVKISSNDSAPDSNCEAGSNSSNKSRKSIEVIYDRKSTSQEKKKSAELVTIDEDGAEIVLDSSNYDEDKIVLDSSTEELHLRFSTGSSNNSTHNTTVYKSCLDSKSNSESSYKSTAWNEPCKRNDTIENSDCQLTNGDDDRNISGTTKTVSSVSDQLVEDFLADTLNPGTSKTATNDSDIDERFNLSSKFSETMESVNMISDSDGDSLSVNPNAENKSQDKATGSSNTSVSTKTIAYENKIRFHIELKYLLHVDENTKEILWKEVMDVHCDPLIENTEARRNSDASGCLADISGNANKETSPGSVISNPQLFPLPMSRFSMASISSSSSVSSAASLAAKLYKDVHFSLPTGRAKHAKRQAMGTVLEEKFNSSETFERTILGWKNTHLITDSIIQSANTIINSPEIFQQDNEPGKSEDKVLSSTPEPSSTEENVLSSAPEPVVQDMKVTSQKATPKSTKDRKLTKRNRTKNTSAARSGRKRKASPEVITTSQEDRVPTIKKKRDEMEVIQSEKMSNDTPTISTPSRVGHVTPRMEALRSLTPQNVLSDEFVGKVVFAKWSDNNYYPGEVTERIRGKLRVKFYDGKSKLLNEEFVIPMPDLLREGLSIYATTKEDDYGTMGIILKSENINNVIHYTVEMDNGKRVKVQIKDIFLMAGQAQILKEEADIDSKSLPKTPQHLSEVTLDNLIDWKRRPPVTPTVSTPKSRKGSSPKATRNNNSMRASGSGSTKTERTTKEVSSSESDTKTSDSNISAIEDVDGVQPELTIIPVTQTSKGPPSRVKGRGRSRSKQTQDDAELGPIPPASSDIFKNMSFILTSTSSDIISRHHTDDSCSEVGTENEEEWLRVPFIKDRIKKQLINGGGTVYDSFKSIPSKEYKNTKLITNAPNLTAKSIQCISVGISAYSHNWVIHCCRENKTLKPSRYELPAGWSLEKKTYIESYDRINKQPFNGMIIGMPILDEKNVTNRSIQFWRGICENAGAGIQLITDTETAFSNVTAILADNRCPSWLVDKADSWEIPLVSTIWIVQCVIAGQSLAPDANPQYKHTFIQS